MLSVGDCFPEYSLPACVGNDPENAFTVVDSSEHSGKWRVVFFWPYDFTFVCPTEIAAFGRMNDKFTENEAQVLGVSADSKYVHYAWRVTHPDLQDLPFPMLADTGRDLISACGVMTDNGVADRATFLIDPDGIIQFSMTTPMVVGRNPAEVLRILQAARSGRMVACNWHPGDAAIDAVELMSAMRQRVATA